MSRDFQEILLTSIRALDRYISQENYKGWDPYDALLADKIPQQLLRNKFFRVVFIQFNLYSPLNFRNVFGIRKSTSNKALALFSRAYYILSDMDRSYLERARSLLDKLIFRTKSVCHSHEFTYYAPKHKLDPKTPDIICLTESVKTLIVAYYVEKDKNLMSLIRKRLDFILSEFLVETNEGAYLKYTPTDKDKIVFNVSASTLEVLTEFMKISDLDQELINIGNSIVNFLVNFQNEEGAWPYLVYTSTGKLRWQIDYHQGFIIDGLSAFLPYISEELRRKVEESLNRGIKFYMTKQFTEKGYSYYRYPIKYPIDIHNQAQGIITFSKLYERLGDRKYLTFAEKITEWTIKNMRSPEGYFYAHKWPWFVNKIPYMRWGQAWMMLALATLLKTREGKK